MEPKDPIAKSKESATVEVKEATTVIPEKHDVIASDEAMPTPTTEINEASISEPVNQAKEQVDLCYETGAESDDDALGRQVSSLANNFSKCGLTINPGNLRSVITDYGILDRTLNEVKELLGISDKLDDDTIKKAEAIGLKDKVNDVICEVVKKRLKMIELGATGEIPSEGMIDGIESPSAIFNEIINDPDMMFRQGEVWNVLISKNAPAVLKFNKLRNGHLQLAEEYFRNYDSIRQALGDDFSVDQIELMLPELGRRVLLQEKLDLEKWSALSANRLESIDGIVNLAETSPQNMEILQDFINRVVGLDTEKGLVIDSLGDNIYFRVDEDGKLEIKVVDYGVFDRSALHDEKSKRYVSDAQGFLSRLQEKITQSK